MKTVYRVNWNTKDIETATVINENYLNPGATVESWLCRDSRGKFTCSKDSYSFSELEAWEEYKNEIKEASSQALQVWKEAERNYYSTVDELVRVMDKVFELEEKSK